MSNSTMSSTPWPRPIAQSAPTAGEPGGRVPPAAQYGLSLALVAVATVLAFVVDHLIPAPNLTLVFVLPVVVAAASFGWGPALVAAVGGALAYDFFFTEPRFTLLMNDPDDIWALALLLVVAVLVSAVAARARRQAVEAREAAEQAEALRALAHVVIHSPSQADVITAAAGALARIFRAPAVVFVENGSALEPTLAGGATVSAADAEAARLALESKLATRGDAYPVERATFDFWPMQSPPHRRSVLGVDLADRDKGRAREPERLVEIVGAYLTLALSRDGAG
jgi:K+-sensing histidine kinase KdpD